MSEQSRREFLRVLASGACTAAGGALVSHCGGWAVNPADAVKAGAIDGAGQVRFGAQQFAQLGKVGGAVLVETADKLTILVVRVGDSDYRAMNGLCSHLGCPVGYVPEHQWIECPCHGARYDLNGNVLRKPATFGLTQYRVRQDPDTGDLLVDTYGPNVPALDAGKITFNLLDLTVADLSTPGSTATFTPIGMPRPIIILRVDAKTVATFDANCTFAPCILSFDSMKSLLDCPCHGCAFDITGAVRQGPARANLRVYTTTFDGTSVQITVPS